MRPDGSTKAQQAHHCEEDSGPSLFVVKSSIVQSTRHFPFIIPAELHSDWTFVLKANLAVNDVVMRIKLGFARFRDVWGKDVAVKILLQWVEPYVWALLQTRWTEQPSQLTNTVNRRACTVSWMEWACVVAVLAGRASQPFNATFVMAAAVAKHLWQAITPFCVACNGDGIKMPVKKFVQTCDNAGATITCGVASAQGINRRLIMDDHPGLSIAVAALLKFASLSPIRLCTAMPAYRWWQSKWKPSGLLETHQQLRECGARTRMPNADMRVDNLRWRPRKQVASKKTLTGPCIFGCRTSAQSTALARARGRWYRVPDPPPWPGVQPGETLCSRCYGWGIGNPRARQRKQQCVQRRQVVVRVGHQ